MQWEDRATIQLEMIAKEEELSEHDIAALRTRAERVAGIALYVTAHSVIRAYAQMEAEAYEAYEARDGNAR